MVVRIRVRHGGRDLDGVIRPGEGAAVAARRIAASAPGTPVARDLSGDPLEFVIDQDLNVTLRPMTRGDLPIVATWRRSDHIRRWWPSSEEPTEEVVADQYAAIIDGRRPDRLWIAEANGRSVGFLQDYRVGDHPEFAMVAPDPRAIGFDYAIGEAAATGRGLGTRVVWAWLSRARQRFPDATTYFAAPDHRNVGSLRLLAKVGFTQGVWFDQPRVGGSATAIGCSLDVARVLG